MNKYLASSDNNLKYSLTLKGVTVLFAVYLFRQLGVDVSENDILVIVELIITAIGAVWSLYGAIRRLKNKM